jgi:hypothetical protein
MHSVITNAHKKIVFLGFSSYFLPIFYKENEFLNYIPLLKIIGLGNLVEIAKKKKLKAAISRNFRV